MNDTTSSGSGTTGSSSGQGPPGEPSDWIGSSSTQPPPPPPPPIEASARLRRSATDRKLGGVAGGLGDYLGIDPVLVRIAFVLIALAGGTGVVAYLVAWVLIPLGDGVPTRPRRGLGDDTKRVVGVGLVGLAVLILAGQWWWDDRVVLPLALIGAGLWLLLRRVPPTDSVDSGDSGGSGVAPTAAGGSGVDRTEPAPRSDTRPSNHVSRVTTGLVAIVAGGFGVAFAAGVDVGLQAVLASCLAVTGAGLVVGGLRGGARGLIGLAGVLVVALCATAIVHIPLSGGVGERTFTPADLDAVADRYRLGAGELTLDLRGVDFSGENVSVHVSIGLGEIDIRAPDDVALDIEARLGAGSIVLLGESTEGAGLEVRDRRPGREGAGRLHLEIDGGLGEVTVR